MRLSNRILNIVDGDDDGWAIYHETTRRLDAGEKITVLTIGEHDRKTEPEILQAMHESAMGGNTGYAYIPGSPSLRAAIAARVEARTGVPTRPGNILVTPGGQAALYAAHTAALDPGDRALYIDPYYATYPGTIRGTGGVDVPVKAHPEHGFQPARTDLDAAAKGARSLLINTPNNPTGVVYSRETLEMIGDVVTKHDMWLISDEVYDTQVWDGEHLSPRQLPGLAERTLVVGSMSKSHAMTGSRIGWIVAPEEVVPHLLFLSTNTTYGVPGFIQDAAEFAINQGPDLEARISEPFRRRRLIAQKALEGANAVRMVPPSGAMYVMLDIRATGLSGEAFAFALLDAEKISVMPGESFGHSAAGHVRVALTVEDSILSDALKRLAGFAASLAG
jgi:arginine:pyruvate transaminase